MGEASAPAVFPPRELEPTGTMVATRRPALAADGSLEDALRAEQATVLEAFGRPEAKEGMRAFLEKREPRLRTEVPPD